MLLDISTSLKSLLQQQWNNKAIFPEVKPDALELIERTAKMYGPWLFDCCYYCYSLPL